MQYLLYKEVEKTIRRSHLPDRPLAPAKENLPDKGTKSLT
jgi:hypothetical protein